MPRAADVQDRHLTSPNAPSVFTNYGRHLRHMRANLRVYFAFLFLTSFGGSVFGLFYPLLLLEAGYREDFIGSFVAFLPLAAGLVAFPAGYLSDRIGRRRALLLFGALTLASLAGRGLFFTPSAIFAFYFLDGLASTLYMASHGPFLFANSEADERVFVFSVAALVSLAAGIAGNLLGGLLPDAVAALRPQWSRLAAYRTVVLTGTVVWAAGAACLLGLADGGSARARQGLAGQMRAVNWRVVAQLAVTGGLMTYGASHFQPFMSIYLTRELGATPAQLGLAQAAVQTCVVAGVLLAPIAAVRLGPVRAVALSQGVSVPLFFVMGHVPVLAVVAACHSLRSMLVQAVGPIKSGFTLSLLAAETRGTANGLLNMTNSFINALAVFLAGRLIFARGYEPAFWVAAAAYTLSTVTFWAFFARARPVAETR
jgi:MFS family permease